MKCLLDLNVVLDVLQKREPFYQVSARVLSKTIEGELEGFLPGHAVTTIYYIVSRHANQSLADKAIDWLLAHLEIIPQDKALFARARSLSLADFEDAAVASAAEATGCEVIVTRNVKDFTGSPVQALTPEELVILIESQAMR